jgi:adenine C2-methylase RlmN of 23S rRNA A2503 and tRNA A37
MILFDEKKLHEYVKENKIQPFREKQILFELYKNQNISWDEMTTLSKDLKQ